MPLAHPSSNVTARAESSVPRREGSWRRPSPAPSAIQEASAGFGLLILKMRSTLQVVRSRIWVFNSGWAARLPPSPIITKPSAACQRESPLPPCYKFFTRGYFLLSMEIRYAIVKNCDSFLLLVNPRGRCIVPDRLGRLFYPSFFGPKPRPGCTELPRIAWILIRDRSSKRRDRPD